MTGRERRRGGSLDDWFADPAPPSRHRPPRAPASEVEPPAHKPDRPTRADLAVALLALVVLTALAAAGIFNGGNGKPSTTAATKATTTTASAAGSGSGLGQTATPPLFQARRGGIHVPTSALKRGERGVQVIALQRALARLGYRPGKIDGRYGPSTEHAVARFQEASTLTSDGVAGRLTLRALRRALNSLTR